MLAIVAPMATELAGIRRAVRDPRGRGMTLDVIGIGRFPATANVARIAERKPDAIVLVGFCGGGDPDLVTGDLHIADAFLGPDRPDPIAADAGLTAGLTSAAKLRSGRVVAGPSATVTSVAGAGLKSELHESVGARTVNMEDYWVAHTAQAAGVPFASVRAVLDPAGVELPGYVMASGGSAMRVALGLAAHPGRLADMTRLTRLARIARNSLTRALLAAVASPSGLRPDLAGAPR